MGVTGTRPPRRIGPADATGASTRNPTTTMAPGRAKTLRTRHKPAADVRPNYLSAKCRSSCQVLPAPPMRPSSASVATPDPAGSAIASRPSGATRKPSRAT